MTRVGCLCWLVAGAAATLLGRELVVRAAAVERGIDAHEQGLHRLDARLRRLELAAGAPPDTFDVAPLLDQLETCRVRTDDLRFALDTLIGVWPGKARVHLPGPAADWEPWPKLRGAVGSIYDADMRGYD